MWTTSIVHTLTRHSSQRTTSFLRACLIDQAMSLDSVQALEGFRGHMDLEVRLPTTVCSACHASMACVLAGLVLNDEPACLHHFSAEMKPVMHAIYACCTGRASGRRAYWDGCRASSILARMDC